MEFLSAFRTQYCQQTLLLRKAINFLNFWFLMTKDFNLSAHFIDMKLKRTGLRIYGTNMLI